MVESGLQWHPSLYAGSAGYYAVGRVDYPIALANALATELSLDGSGRLLDVGCGPGNFTLLLAPWFRHVTGVDADRDMLAEADQRAKQAGVGNVQWLHLRAEELPAGLDSYRVVSFAQSFHWMDQLLVARTALGMLEEGGACVHVHANTHEGVDTDAVLPHPRPPRTAINELVESYLGLIPRNRKGLLWADEANREEEVWRAAGFSGPHRIEVPGDIVARTSDQIVAAIFSLSSSTPHLFGERREAFEVDLRRLLQDANPTGIFSEQMRDIAADIWRPSKH
ncbi:MAG TPA: class I SAM-dependent methyltransferase [Propionibacteriaceae bacterium]|nr:class I SAM-dependent methyltransferase [Propionibacteriaceae bacterium]